MADVAAQIDALQASQRLRTRPVFEHASARELVFEGRQYLNFCGNDYLGLSQSEAARNAMATAAEKHGTGATASQVVVGRHRIHAELEAALADWLGVEAVALFSSGYLANLGVAATLINRGEKVLGDRLVHASIIDAQRLAGARQLRYRHLDLADLARRGDGTDPVGVVSDGVFSMDGDAPDLPEWHATASNIGWTWLDDAHGFGVLGHKGRGLLAEHQMSADAINALVGTFGKAFGTAGAFVAGSEAFITLLTNRARSLVYSTAMPPPVAAATLANLKLLQADGWRREKIAALRARLLEGLARLECKPQAPPVAAIVPIPVGQTNKALQLSRHLKEQGIWVTAIRPPTVPEGQDRLRVTLTCEHEDGDIDRLLEALDAGLG